MHREVILPVEFGSAVARRPARVVSFGKHIFNGASCRSSRRAEATFQSLCRACFPRAYSVYVFCLVQERFVENQIAAVRDWDVRCARAPVPEDMYLGDCPPRDSVQELRRDPMRVLNT